MINNNSTKKIQTIKTVFKVVWIIAIVLGVVLGILAIVSAACDEKQPATASDIAIAVIGLILGTAMFTVLGCMILCLISYFANKREENIAYMNARLAHKEAVNKAPVVKAVAHQVATKKVAVKKTAAKKAATAKNKRK